MEEVVRSVLASKKTEGAIEPQHILNYMKSKYPSLEDQQNGKDEKKSNDNNNNNNDKEEQ